MQVASYYNQVLHEDPMVKVPIKIHLKEENVLLAFKIYGKVLKVNWVMLVYNFSCVLLVNFYLDEIVTISVVHMVYNYINEDVSHLPVVIPLEDYVSI